MVSNSFDEIHSADFSSVYDVVLEIPRDIPSKDEIFNLTNIIQGKRFIIIQRMNDANVILHMSEFILWAIF